MIQTVEMIVAGVILSLALVAFILAVVDEISRGGKDDDDGDDAEDE